MMTSKQRTIGWLIHLLTASGAVLGLFTLHAIHHKRFLAAFWLMGAAVVIDAVDGVLARRFRVAAAVPAIDGALLDNLIDYLNYVLTPAFFLLIGDLLPLGSRGTVSSLIVLASAYQFSQRDAKTSDHFFKGFPSYWNIVVFTLFLWQLPSWVNLMFLLLLVPMVFVPIKYVYPSRLDCLTRNRWLRGGMLGATLLYGAATLSLLWIYPRTSALLVTLSIAYLILYVAVSVYRTLVPLRSCGTGEDGTSLRI